MAKTILIIDDEVDVGETIQELLVMFGYVVQVANSPSVAFQMLAQAQFQLIVSDINMPGMSGMELIKRLKSENNPCPVIFVSGSDSQSMKAEAMASGAIDFIAKPFDINDLVERVKKAC